MLIKKTINKKIRKNLQLIQKEVKEINSKIINIIQTKKVILVLNQVDKLNLCIIKTKMIILQLLMIQ